MISFLSSEVHTR